MYVYVLYLYIITKDKIGMTSILKVNIRFSYLKMSVLGRALWLMPIIPATLEAEIGRTAVQGQPGQKVSETPNTISTNKLGVQYVHVTPALWEA
jgi:hypothetical protein